MSAHDEEMEMGAPQVRAWQWQGAGRGRRRADREEEEPQQRETQEHSGRGHVHGTYAALCADSCGTETCACVAVS